MLHILVIQTEHPPGFPQIVWFPLGVHPWRSPSPQLSLFVKLTFTWSGQSPQSSDPTLAARLSPAQEPLSRALPLTHPGAAPNELYYPSDFVPRKQGADILLVGHARSPTPTPRIAGHLAVAGVWRPFVAIAGMPVTAIPLTTAYLQPEDGSHGQPLGPIVPPGNPESLHEKDFDYSRYNAASYLQRARAIPPDCTIALGGLSPDGQRRIIRLPGITPIVTFDAPFRQDIPVDLVCDTLWIDTDREIAVLVWRGAIEILDDNSPIQRIVLSLAQAGEEIDPEARKSALMRGRFGFAVREDDPPDAHLPRTEEDEQQLIMARYGTWDADAPPPKITLPQYVTISAELAEWPQDRKKTLERHSLNEDAWAIEERGWLETIANAAMNGDVRLADRYSELFVEAQDALATPAERAQTLPEYAEIHAAMDAAPDPEVVLGERKITLAQWLRMERRWARAAADDSKIRDELEQLIAARTPKPHPTPPTPEEESA